MVPFELRTKMDRTETSRNSSSKSGALAPPSSAQNSSAQSSDKSFEQNDPQFEQRKADHIRLALDPSTQTTGTSGLDRLRLRHEAFPEIDFEQVDSSVTVFGAMSGTPMFVSSMTAGHTGSVALNLTMARVCEKRNWPMGVGSQRKQLIDSEAAREWAEIRKQCQSVRFFGNIGLSQAIRTPTSEIRRLADSLEAVAMIVHTNPLQECLQPEGTPQFAGGLKAVERLCRELGLPVIVKETGCGFSRETLLKLRHLGLAAVDVSGMGGTHWGRIEGGRSAKGTLLADAAETYRDWGIGTVESLMSAVQLEPDYAVWASGGVRSGLDAAKLAAAGAEMVGFAKPVIEAALNGEEALDNRLAAFEYEFKMALFCTGSRSVAELREKRAWELLK